MNASQRGNGGRKSFAAPLIVLIVLVLLTAFTALSLFVTSMMKKQIGIQQEQNFMSITDAIKDLLETELDENEHIIQGYGKSISYIFSTCSLAAGGTTEFMSPEDLPEDRIWAINNILETVSYSNPFFETVFISDNRGRVMFSTDGGIIGADISGRDYFMAVVDGFETTYTTPDALISKATGNLTIVHAVALVEGGQNMGLLAASLNLNKLGTELVLTKKIGETGYPYVLDRKGMVLIHPSEDLLYTQSQDVDPFFQTVLDTEEDVFSLEYTLQGVAKEGVFIKIPELGWTVCLAISKDEAYGAVRVLRNILILSSLVLSLFIIALLSYYIRKNLIRRIRAVETLMEEAASGDLSDRGIIRGQDEISGMTGNLNSLLDSLSRFFTGLGGSLQSLDDLGLNLSSNMEETAAAVHQIRTNVGNSLLQIEKQGISVSSTATTVEQMTQNIRSLDRNIERQNENIEQGSSAVEEMIAQIRSVSASTDEAEKIMGILTESSRSGRQNLESVASMVTAIAEKSRRLEQANALISGIAARTNLLAMNAAIEAAHAGQSGRGFAVVADEIRKLAEQSTSQSAQVKQTISDINSSIMEVVQGSEISTRSFEEILANIDRMGRITGEIQNSMEEQVSGSNLVSDSLLALKNAGEEVKAGSEEMTQGNRIILEAVQNLTHISSEVSQAIQEIGNGMNEINQAVTAVADLAQENRTSIETVRREASRYRTDPA